MSFKCNNLRNLLKLMTHNSGLRQKAIDLFKSGKSKSFIAKVLNVSKPSVTRWLQNIEKKSEINVTSLKPSEVAEAEDWYSQSVVVADEIAVSNRELRLILTDMLKKQLQDDQFNVRAISCLSTAIERHTSIEWKARGLDYLDPNRAIARLIVLGFEVTDPSAS